MVDILMMIGVQYLKTCIAQSYIFGYLCDPRDLFVLRFLGFQMHPHPLCTLYRLQVFESNELMSPVF